MIRTDPTTDMRHMVVNRTDALRVARILSAQRGHSAVYELTAKVAPHLWAEFMMTDEEIRSLIKQDIVVRRV